MIYLITGTPGAGKTSNTLWDFLFNPAYKDRPKYATFINGFDYEKHCVTQLENIENWRELPPGALVLVDEADKYMPAVGRGDLPEWIRELARSRHYGIDFFIITQLHSMINHHVRGLIAAHTHYHRAWGMKTTSRFRWETLQTNVNSLTARNLAQKTRVRVNPRIFELYKSTDLDTQRPQLPWRWISVAVFSVFFIVAAALYIRHFFLGNSHHDEKPASVSAPAIAASSSHPGQINLSGSSAKPATSLADFTPRISIDPSTAPIYDDLTKPTDFPRLAACVDSLKSCNCYTQQATPIGIPQDICRQLTKQGWFDRWRTGRAQSDVVLSGRPDESVARDSIHAAESQRPDPVVIAQESPEPHLADSPYQSIFQKK